MGYQQPVPYSRSTSWAAHKRRNPPSSEPGIDMFCPLRTPVLAAESGRIFDTGDSIQPATGRFVTIDLDDGRRVRYLHLSSRSVSVGMRVRRGQIIGYSGATGYGEEDWSWNVAETGGAHVHMTLWPTHRYVFGSGGTLDPEPYFDRGGFAGTKSAPLPEPIKKEEEPDMRLINGGQDRGIALVGAGYYKSLTGDQVAAWSKIIDPPKDVSPGEFDQIRASAVWGDAEYTSSATAADTSVERIAQRVAEILRGNA